MNMLTTYKKLLEQFLQTKSISTDIQYQKGINDTAEFLKNLFEKNKFSVEVVKGYDNPIVLATYIENPKFEHCLIYGHYDVQPAEKNEGWNSDPFSLFEKNNRIFGRGVVDNKGQVLIHIVSILELIKNNKLGYNITFMIEGNEETGSPLLEKFIKDNTAKLKANFSIISDGEMDIHYPTIEAGFRGGFNATLTLQSSTTDLHSGLYGGSVPNSIHEMNLLLSKMIDQQNHILIPGFYKGVDIVTDEQKKNNNSIPFDEENYKKIAGVKKLASCANNIYTATGLLPTLQVTGIQSGYTGEGYRNGIAGKATAKINFRLVKSQNGNEIIQIVEKFIKKNLPEYIDYAFETTDSYDGIKLELNTVYIKKAAKILEKVYKAKPIYKYCGGSIPIVSMFEDILSLKNVLIPLGNEDCGMHAANENFNIDYIKKGLEFSYEFFSK